MILNEIKPSKTIHSDKRKAYANLTSFGIQHETVNYGENFVDPAAVVHVENLK